MCTFKEPINRFQRLSYRTARLHRLALIDSLESIARLLNPQFGLRMEKYLESILLCFVFFRFLELITGRVQEKEEQGPCHLNSHFYIRVQRLSHIDRIHKPKDTFFLSIFHQNNFSIIKVNNSISVNLFLYFVIILYCFF